MQENPIYIRFTLILFHQNDKKNQKNVEACISCTAYINVWLILLNSIILTLIFPSSPFPLGESKRCKSPLQISLTVATSKHKSLLYIYSYHFLRTILNS
ncbi:uncharacterized protein OCT59_018839 [Rhizophagus irregularis]|uniref:uncharacterized protein n=1 Tax=Rhizophagus irregularis TaxID=588596 RepID=UPI003326EB4D|nr:hypothetical protein OCT59_018839 [Rhizophagus irregularis]